MGKLVISQFITVDGVIDSPGNDKLFDRGGWAFQFERGPDADKFKLDELMAADILLLGRLTYEGFAEAWPNFPDDPTGYTSKMNTMPKHVVSATLTDPTWNNTTVISGDVGAAVGTLKEQVSGDVLIFGSAQLTQALAELDLVDEYRLMVYPIILGAGKKLFADTTHTAPLRLTETRPLGSQGVSLQVYQAAGKNE